MDDHRETEPGLLTSKVIKDSPQGGFFSGLIFTYSMFRNGVLILDEIDAICTDKNAQEIGQAMNKLDAPEYSNVSVIFIANNIETLPDVIKSRTQPKIEIVKPNLQSRARILNYYLRSWMQNPQKLEQDCLEAGFVDELAKATDDFSIRDIENLITIAQQEKFIRTSSAATLIARQDFLKAVTIIRPGLTMSEIWKGAKNVVAMLDECTRNPLVAQGIMMGVDYLRRSQPVQPGFWGQHNITDRILDTGQHIGSNLAIFGGQYAILALLAKMGLLLV